MSKIPGEEAGRKLEPHTMPFHAQVLRSHPIRSDENS